MEIPIELFILGIVTPIGLALFGFIRNPQIPAMLAFGGMFILFLSVVTDTIIMDYFQTGINELVTRYSVSGSIDNTWRLNGTYTGYGETLDANSILLGKTIDTISISATQVGNPQGNITLGVFNASPNHTIYDFCTIPVSQISINPFGGFNTCVIDTPVILTQSTVIGISYLSGNSTDYIAVHSINNGFDSTNTRAVIFNPSSGFWSSSPLGGSDKDVRMVLYSTEQVLNQSYEFTQEAKVFFALLGVIFMLCGGLMIAKNE